MKIVVVVDANVILSALLGGKASKILFFPQFQFVTSEFTLSEVRKYIPRLSRKLGTSEDRMLAVLDMLPLLVYGEHFYREKLRESKKLIESIDSKDTDVLALALKLQTYVWSQDKHFQECGYEKLLKTYDFIHRLS